MLQEKLRWPKTQREPSFFICLEYKDPLNASQFVKIILWININDTECQIDAKTSLIQVTLVWQGFKTQTTRSGNKRFANATNFPFKRYFFKEANIFQYLSIFIKFATSFVRSLILPNWSVVSYRVAVEKRSWKWLFSTSS